QRERFRAVFDPGRVSVILSSDEPIGLLGVDRSLLKEAAQRGVRVRLQVLHQNPARRLYERLGFHAVSETPTHVEMVHE
ncbi:MAG TPA: hypothetical protein VJ826_05065, partial [Candidatus Polarisedimenticolaceae bacterium]|nr:hypothetical protein [Candidatus Polarisedimenticolaceae bacterium]